MLWTALIFIAPVRAASGIPTGRAGRGDYRCRHDLTAQASAAPAPAELIALQARLVAILDPAVSDDDAVALVDRLIDLLVIATHVGLDFRAIDRDRRNMASVLAGPLSHAHHALINPRGPRLRAIAISDLKLPQSALPNAWDGISPALAAIVLEHRDAGLRPADRLRYRSMTGAGRRPEEADPSTRCERFRSPCGPTGRSGCGRRRSIPTASGSPRRSRCACPARPWRSAASATAGPGRASPSGWGYSAGS